MHCFKLENFCKVSV